eukprot:scaffold14909_cov107-Isochrysis_galbana.AAC.1
MARQSRPHAPGPAAAAPPPAPQGLRRWRWHYSLLLLCVCVCSQGTGGRGGWHTGRAQPLAGAEGGGGAARGAATRVGIGAQGTGTRPPLLSSLAPWPWQGRALRHKFAQLL